MTMTESGTDASLDAALRAFGEAWARGDIDALRSLLSPSYTHNDASGTQLGYEDWLAYAAGRKGRTTQITFHDLNTRRFGDIAIVTGLNRLTGGGVFKADDNRDLSFLFLQVWRLDNGRWLREAFQATPVLEEGYS